MILPKVRDPRFITIRRGGTLTDDDHRLLALWAATCAEHVLPLFEDAVLDDPRPRLAIAHARLWARGEIGIQVSRTAAGKANAAARPLAGAPRFAAYAAAQAAATAHVAAHELGAAAYAIKAVRAAAPAGESDAAGRAECAWQREQLPDEIRALVLDDQRLRNDICWHAFDCAAGQISAALPPIESLLGKSEKAIGKVAPDTWQHAMLQRNISALRIGRALMAGGAHDGPVAAREELKHALVAFDDMIGRTQQSGAKFAEGTSHHTLQRNRLNALRIARALTETELARSRQPKGEPQ